MTDERLIGLRELSLSAQKRYSLKKRNSFRINSYADYFIEPKTLAALKHALLYAKENAIPYVILGGGTNVLFSDNGVRGFVISMKRLSAIRYESDKRIVAEAGADVSLVSEKAYARSFTGLEFAYGLPGTVGGAAFMNARCYGNEMSDVIERIGYLDETIVYREMGRAEMEFDYKKSPFQDGKKIIITVSLRLKDGDKEAIRKTMQNNYRDRRMKGHFRYPSAGSIFLNDRSAGMPSGALIDKAGLKGLREGGVSVAQFHGNFIINDKGGTANDVRTLIKNVRETVKKEHGITLTPEIRFLGAWGSDPLK